MRIQNIKTAIEEDLKILEQELHKGYSYGYFNYLQGKKDYAESMLEELNNIPSNRDNIL